MTPSRFDCLPRSIGSTKWIGEGGGGLLASPPSVLRRVKTEGKSTFCPVLLLVAIQSSCLWVKRANNNIAMETEGVVKANGNFPAHINHSQFYVLKINSSRDNNFIDI